MQTVIDSSISRNFEMRALMVSVVDLLDEAVKQIAEDQHEARSTIARAHCLLSSQCERVGDLYQLQPRRSALIAWQVRIIREYIDAHLGSKILVSDLSALVNLSEGHFARAFKSTFGVGPHTFLMRRRIEKASQLMLSSAATLSEISLACGFADQAHLCKAFRLSIGRSPSKWRRERYALPVNAFNPGAENGADR